MAEDLGVGLIVMGSRGAGDKEGTDGKRPDSVVRRAPCPVMVIRK